MKIDNINDLTWIVNRRSTDILNWYDLMTTGSSPAWPNIRIMDKAEEGEKNRELSAAIISVGLAIAKETGDLNVSLSEDLAAICPEIIRKIRSKRTQ